MSHMLEREWHKLPLEKRLRFREKFWVVSHRLLVNSFVYHRDINISSKIVEHQNIPNT